MSATATPRVYCTYFDSGYLGRGLALIASLREHGDNSPVYVLALDNAAAIYLEENAPDKVFVLRIEELERAEPELLPLKAQRSRMEYYFTCTPLLIRFVMNKQNIPGGMSIYLDGDLFFFNNPQLVIDAMADSSVGIIEHRYPDSLAEKLSKYGRFNVGWVGFRDDQDGRKVLDWYASKTIEWCSDKPEEGKYADQGYLDWFPEFEGVAVLESAGFNLAPWNTKRHKLSLHLQAIKLEGSSASLLQVDGEPLVFFHFHGLRALGKWFVSSQIIYRSHMSQLLRDAVYQPYVNKLSSIDIAIAKNLSGASIKKRGNGLSGAMSRFRKNLVNVVSIFTGNALKPKD